MQQSKLESRAKAKDDTPLKPKRRRFISGVIYALTSLMGGTITGAALTYLIEKPEDDGDSGWVDAGQIADLRPGSPRRIFFAKVRNDGWNVRAEKSAAWIVLEGGSTVKAFSPFCTHLGCAYHWREEKKAFLCPCHGSVFGADGKVVSGPASRPLDRYPVKIEHGRVWLGPVESPKRA